VLCFHFFSLISLFCSLRFVTRDAFMKNVVNQQNFTHYPDVLELIKKSEQLFRTIQAMETVVPLQSEEKLFLEAIIGLNYQASRLQEAEKEDTIDATECSSSSSPRKLPQIEDPKKTTEITQNNNNTTTQSTDSNYQIGLQLDTATSVLVESAAKLSHFNNHPTSPSLNNILSWMELTKSNGSGMDKQDRKNHEEHEHGHDHHRNNLIQEKESTDVEEGDAGVILGSMKRPFEKISSSRQSPREAMEGTDGIRAKKNVHHP
jgi:hypothetical protein